MSAESKQGSAASQPARTSTRTILVAVALVAAAALVVGFVLSRATIVTQPGPAVTQELTGTVAKVNAGGTNICLSVPDQTELACSGLWVPAGTPFPAVGDSITVWVVNIPRGGHIEEQYILQPGAPAATS